MQDSSRRKGVHRLVVRKAAARVAVQAARNLGKEPDPRLLELLATPIPPADLLQPRHSLVVRQAAAEVAIAAALKLGKEPDPRLLELLNERPGRSS